VSLYALCPAAEALLALREALNNHPSFDGFVTVVLWRVTVVLWRVTVRTVPCSGGPAGAAGGPEQPPGLRRLRHCSALVCHCSALACHCSALNVSLYALCPAAEALLALREALNNHPAFDGFVADPENPSYGGLSSAPWSMKATPGVPASPQHALLRHRHLGLGCLQHRGARHRDVSDGLGLTVPWAVTVLPGGCHCIVAPRALTPPPGPGLPATTGPVWGCLGLSLCGLTLSL